MAGKADKVSSVLASACHVGGPIYVNPGELALVYGTLDLDAKKPQYFCKINILDIYLVILLKYGGNGGSGGRSKVWD